LERGGYILALGTIEPRKNHVRLIRAFERLVERESLNSDLRLVIAGRPGWGSEPVVRAIADSQLGSRISMLGYVPGADIAALISGAGAVAYVSLYEGFGLPVVEALACGAPIVTSNVSSMPEVAGDAGFLVNPLDVEDIERGLREALEAGTADSAAVSSAARAQASLFSWGKTARRVVELYDTRL
jgi:glycosyltransferase involved in cell wall biosynthesis